MQLLGPYNSTLQAFHYEELLNLYKQAIAGGGFSGNKTFDEAVINTLIQQSQDFASLPLASAGQRVTDDSLNYPLALLTARFNALVSEAGSFESRAAGLIEVLKKDTSLLDMLLAGADLQKWLSEQPILETSTKFSWDYGMGNGPASGQITKEDPANAVLYPTDCPTNTYIDINDGSVFTGLVAPEATKVFPIQAMSWSWIPMTAGEQSEALYGSDWAELNLLEDRPIINFLPDPAVTTLLPSGGSVSGVFSIGGTVLGGSVPIYVRTLFVPRRNNVVLTPQNAITDPSFELGGASWSFGEGWALSSDGNARTGLQYARKTPLTAWSSITNYDPGDVVYYLGREYRSLTNNLNSIPNDPSSTDWTAGGVVGTVSVLKSQTFPMAPRSRVYVEAWIKNLAANGLLTISLVCLDVGGNEISPAISIPSVSSAQDYLEVFSVLQALNSSNVVAGRIEVWVYGNTTGAWAFDDLRVHLPQSLSNYTVNQDDVAIYIPQANGLPLSVYFANEDFVIDDISNVTFMGLKDGTAYTVRFTENYPGYQCSVNESVWSPVIMLDPARPYPDTETAFDPIAITTDSVGNRTLFPITDEKGVPTGLTLKTISRPLFEYYIQITTPAQPQYGTTAMLEIDLKNATYMNGLTIAPFSKYPMRLVKVETESFATNTRQTVGAPNALIDRPMVLTFSTTILRKIYLTLYQENYDLNTLVAEPPDFLRRDTLVSLQAVLPFNVRRPSRATLNHFTGAQYTFGVEGIAGIYTSPVLPGVFIAGPHRFVDCPDVYRFDASTFNPDSISMFHTYLCWKAYNSSGVVISSELSGVEIYPGTCKVFPFPSGSLLNRADVNHVDIFLKFVLRDSDVVLQRYLLQVSSA